MRDQIRFLKSLAEACQDRAIAPSAKRMASHVDPNGTLPAQPPARAVTRALIERGVAPVDHRGRVQPGFSARRLLS